jgi:hypothetical protein
LGVIQALGLKLGEIFLGKIIDRVLDPVTGQTQVVRAPPKLQTPAQDAKPAIKTPSVLWLILSTIALPMFLAALQALSALEWGQVVSPFWAAAIPIVLSNAIALVLRLQPPTKGDTP